MSSNSLFLFLGLFFSTTAGLTQSAFEKGYFVDRAGEKTDCYILTEEWNAGDHLTFRKDYKEPSQSKPFAEISEVSVSNTLKVLHVKASVDISGDTPNLFSYTRDPEWSEQDIILWTLVEGTYNLYVYQNDGLTRYFYSAGSMPFQPLVFKKYKTTAGVEINDSFRLALFQNVNCVSNQSNYFNELSYTEKDLVNHFLAENKCAGSTTLSYPKAKSNELLQTLPALTSSNTIENSTQEKTAVKENSKSPNAVRYFGLEINQLLHQIIDLNSNNNAAGSPYQIQYSSNSRKTGRGVSYGLAYGRSTFKDDSNNTIRESTNRSISFRIGYDRKVNWGKRWIGLHGYDLTVGGARLNTKSSQNGPQIEIENKTSFWGFGPRVGLMFNISQRVFLGTEATYYLQFTKGSQTISTGQPNSTQKSSDFTLTLPVTLFLSIKIKE